MYLVLVLNKDVIVMIEYHYIVVGSSNAEYYTELATEAPYQKARVYLSGNHYITPL